MNRQLAKHHAAACLRRERERHAAEWEVRKAIQEARRKGREEARERAQSVRIPPGFLEAILDRMGEHAARDLATELGKALPGEVHHALVLVARAFARDIRFSAGAPGEGAHLRKMLDRHMGDVTFRLSLPPVHCGLRVPREEIELSRGRFDA